MAHTIAIITSRRDRKSRRKQNGRNGNNLIPLKIDYLDKTIQHKQSKVYNIPIILSTNVRAIRNKVNEIQHVAELNSIGVICVT